MEDSQKNGNGSKLQGVIVRGLELPQYIFLDRFDRYLFFDADIRSSEALISTLHEVAKACLGSNLQVHVFASSDRGLLGRLDANSDWVTQVNEINKSLRRTGDSNGLVFVDMSRKWIVYQRRPIDVGVFAFDCGEGLPGLKSAIDDCFFDCLHIANWIVGKSQRDVDLVNSFGGDYLAELIRNYCDASKY